MYFKAAIYNTMSFILSVLKSTLILSEKSMCSSKYEFDNRENHQYE